MGSTPDLKPASPHVALDVHPVAAPVLLMEATNAGMRNCEEAA
jgi:hypothetical protein